MALRNKGEGNMNKPTQNMIVLEHMRQYGYITPMDAVMRYDIMRLWGRIFELREQGYNIETINRRTKHGKQYAEYRLKEGD